MPKIKDLSPKFKVPTAEKELQLLLGQEEMGLNRGGLSLYSNKFKRGYGDAVFGSDENGIWLGAAEFSDSPFNVDMSGALAAKSATFKDEDDTTIIDSKGLISTASFVSESVEIGSPSKTTSSTSYADITGASLSFKTTRNTKVLFIATMTGYTQDFEQIMLFQFELDGNKIGAEFALNRDNDGNTSITVSSHVIETVVSGSHTIKVQFRQNLGGSPNNAVLETAFLPARLSYVILGK